MRRHSEMMDAILKSPEAQRMIDYISPIYDESYVGLNLLNAQGVQLDDMYNWISQLTQGIVPQTVPEWLISYWEMEYGIPIDPSMSLTDRRERLFLTISTRAPMNPYKMERLASFAASNLPCRVAENVAPNTFAVWISSNGNGDVSQGETVRVENNKTGFIDTVTVFGKTENGVDLKNPVIEGYMDERKVVSVEFKCVLRSAGNVKDRLIINNITKKAWIERRIGASGNVLKPAVIEELVYQNIIYYQPHMDYTVNGNLKTTLQVTHNTGVVENAVRAAVTRAKPSHLIFDVKHEQGVEHSIYPASCIQMARTTSIRQVN